MMFHGKSKNFLNTFKSIRITMLFSFSVLILSTLIIFSFVSLNYTQKSILDNSIEYTLKLVSQINNDMDSYIDYMDNISEMVVRSTDVRKYFFGQNIPSDEREQLYLRILTQFQTVIKARGDIANVAVIAQNGESIINTGEDAVNEFIDLKTVDWLQGTSVRSDIELSAPHVQNVIKDNYKWVVTMSRKIDNPYTQQKAAGIFFIDLNYRVINDLCESNRLGNNSYIFVMNEQGKIIYHPQQQLLYRGLKSEKINEVLNAKDKYFVTQEGEDSKLYTIDRSDKTGWIVVGVAQLSELMRAKKQAQNIYLLTACILMLAAILFSTFIASSITKPIKKLKNSMRQMESGAFENVAIEVADASEIGSLSNSFNLMAEKIKQLMEENTYEQEQKRISELRALQSQINPHFLYNTLDSIIWMAEGGQNQEVVLMTSSLARLLRQSISNEKELVSIGQEIGYVKSYLTIQKMRYKDKLEFEITVEPEVEQERIIKLVLQPLVENAIYHGIKYKDTKGLIQVKGYLKGEDILLQVIDNGQGMEEAELASIFDKKSEKNPGGVGIYNVQMRLQLYYGKQYGLKFQSNKDEGTVASILIPRATREEKNDVTDKF